MPESLSVDELVARLAELRLSRSGAILVALDGFGCAGKTTLVRHLVDRLPGAVAVPLDDFARPGTATWEIERFRQQVLTPLLAGRDARYQPWTWDRPEPGPERTVPAGSLVLVEGVSATDRALGDPWQLTVWVDAPRAERRRRMRERDDEPTWEQWERAWIASEEAYAADQRPRERVDVVVDGRGFARGFAVDLDRG